jgi:hypothetical protein
MERCPTLTHVHTRIIAPPATTMRPQTAPPLIMRRGMRGRLIRGAALLVYCRHGGCGVQSPLRMSSLAGVKVVSTDGYVVAVLGDDLLELVGVFGQPGDVTDQEKVSPTSRHVSKQLTAPS